MQRQRLVFLRSISACLVAALCAISSIPQAFAEVRVDITKGSSQPLPIATPLIVAILICAVGTVVMGAYPEPWVRAVMNAANSIF